MYASDAEFQAQMQIRKADPRGIIRWERKFQGAFRDVFTVKGFPFDVQAPQIVVRINSQYYSGGICTFEFPFAT